jgi:hypothetical protein
MLYPEENSSRRVNNGAIMQGKLSERYFKQNLAARIKPSTKNIARNTSGAIIHAITKGGDLKRR